MWRWKGSGREGVCTFMCPPHHTTPSCTTVTPTTRPHRPHNPFPPLGQVLLRPRQALLAARGQPPAAHHPAGGARRHPRAEPAPEGFTGALFWGVVVVVLLVASCTFKLHLASHPTHSITFNSNSHHHPSTSNQSNQSPSSQPPPPSPLPPQVQVAGAAAMVALYMPTALFLASTATATAATALPTTATTRYHT